jgi:hypothetical protein
MKRPILIFGLLVGLALPAIAQNQEQAVRLFDRVVTRVEKVLAANPVILDEVTLAGSSTGIGYRLRQIVDARDVSSSVQRTQSMIRPFEGRITFRARMKVNGGAASFINPADQKRYHLTRDSCLTDRMFVYDSTTAADGKTTVQNEFRVIRIGLTFNRKTWVLAGSEWLDSYIHKFLQDLGASPDLPEGD